MKAEQRFYTVEEGWSSQEVFMWTQLVLAFVAPSLIKEESTYNSLKRFYPNAEIVLTSSSWEIMEDEVKDNSISVNALTFNKTPIKVVSKEIKNMNESFDVWKEIASDINGGDLQYTLIFWDWLSINADQLLIGMKEVLNKRVWISWALAGAGLPIQPAYVSLNWVAIEESRVVLIGFYWDAIKVWDASFWWWNIFGIERKITKSSGSTIYEIDGEPILDLYKRYLWEKSKWLPWTGIMFPISIYDKDKENPIVRTLYSVDEELKSITFTGETPEGNHLFFMNTTLSKLIEGVWKSTEVSLNKNKNVEFALLISCTWRRVIFQQRVEDEVEEVRNILWNDCVIWGLYAYGEIWINGSSSDYVFHNQTMTIALFSEDI